MAVLDDRTRTGFLLIAVAGTVAGAQLAVHVLLPKLTGTSPGTPADRLPVAPDLAAGLAGIGRWGGAVAVALVILGWAVFVSDRDLHTDVHRYHVWAATVLLAAGGVLYLVLASKLVAPPSDLAGTALLKEPLDVRLAVSVPAWVLAASGLVVGTVETLDVPQRGLMYGFLGLEVGAVLVFVPTFTAAAAGTGEIGLTSLQLELAGGADLGAKILLALGAWTGWNRWRRGGSSTVELRCPDCDMLSTYRRDRLPRRKRCPHCGHTGPKQPRGDASDA